MTRLPRSIKIVVHDGRHLDYRVAGSKKSPQTRKWRVIFIGGDRKQATGIVDEQEGFPRWDCEVLISTPKPVDSVRMLVVDGKEREVGQVVIALTDLPWPPAPPPALVTSQLHVCDLLPTKRNPNPAGQISFWLWALDYWPEGTVPANISSSTHSKHGTIRGSLSHIGAALKSQQHPALVAAPKNPGDADNHSRLGNKLRHIKNRVNNRGANGSHISSTTGHSRMAVAPQHETDEASVLMGASIISSHPGLGSMGWTPATSEVGGRGGGGEGVESGLLNAAANNSGAIRTKTNSYNPLAPPEDDDDDERVMGGTRMGRSPSLFAASTPGPNSASNSASNHAEGNQVKSRRRAVVDHLRNRISRSSANISEIGHKIRSRRSSPDGSRCEQEFKASQDESNASPVSSVAPKMRPDLRPVVRLANPNLEPNPLFAEKTVKEEWGLPQSSLLPSKPVLDNISTAAPYGLHPEEGPGKSKEDMTKRELIDLANLLEERLITTRANLIRVNMEQNQLNAQIEDLNSDLTETRTQLSSLRNRLLEDNLTQYLEVNGTSPTRSLPSEQLTTFQTSMKNGNNSSEGFLSRARALASRSIGGIAGSSTPQPNIGGSVTPNQQSIFSSPVRPHSQGINYDSVW